MDEYEELKPHEKGPANTTSCYPSGNSMLHVSSPIGAIGQDKSDSFSLNEISRLRIHGGLDTG